MRAWPANLTLNGASWLEPLNTGNRWGALDRLRAVAVVFMIQGHTFSALLEPSEMPASLSRLHALLHGLTAPAFLFGAGLAFGTATYAAYQQQRAMGEVLKKRLLRYLMLIMLGYALQLPGGSLWMALHAQGDQLALVCRVGPLQLIGVVLALCQLAVLALPTARKHASLAAVLGVVVMFQSTPVTHSGFAGDLGAFLGSFFEDRGGAHFPIFPWAAFVLFGVGTAGLLHQRERLWRALPFTAVGASLALCAYTAFQSAAAEQDEHWSWRTSPSYLLFRLGAVVMLLGLLHLNRRRNERAGASGWSALLATHSLVAYVVHLYLLYGSPLTPSLVLAFGRSMGLLPSVVVSCLVLAATLAVTRLWDWLEREQLVMLQHKRAGLALLALSVLVR